MSQLEDLKTMLNIKSDDVSDDKMLSGILNRTTNRMMFKAKIKDEASLPPVLIDDIIEIAVKRYNRITNEGMTGYTQDGLSMQFNASDFDEFEDDINDWLKQQAGIDDGPSKVVFFDPWGN